MKLPIFVAAFAVASVPAFSQATTGVSNPEPAIITTSPETSVAVKRKPNAAIPAVAPKPAGSNEVYGAYVPYRAAGSSAQVIVAKSAFDPDANIVTSVDPEPAADNAKLDADVVTRLDEKAGEIREGTLLRARTRKELSTSKTIEGSAFSAELTEDVLKDGRVILPVGSVLDGRVTQIRSGKRISGAAMMHLEPRSVTLPDGTQYILHAQLIDTSQAANMRIGTEGNLLRKDHAAETLAVMGGVTGAGAVAGGMIGGGGGALVGAGLGAGAGTIVWLRQDRQATLPQDSVLVFSLTMPMVLKPFHVGGLAVRESGGQ